MVYFVSLLEIRNSERRSCEGMIHFILLKETAKIHSPFLLCLVNFVLVYQVPTLKLDICSLLHVKHISVTFCYTDLEIFYFITVFPVLIYFAFFMKMFQIGRYEFQFHYLHHGVCQTLFPTPCFLPQLLQDTVCLFILLKKGTQIIISSLF